MRKAISNSLRIGLVWSALCLSLCVKSQSAPAPKIETPNVASLDKFGDVPVDLSTGVPNISIPIHTLNCGSISVPIALRYHPSSLRIAQHPGWVGLGWDLQSIGSITKQDNWIPDDYTTSQNSPNSVGSITLGSLTSTYYPLPGPSPPVSGSAILSASDWSSTIKLKNYFNVGAGAMNDVCADEYSFNFLGYSGKFYFVNPTVGWQVVADQSIKVELLNNANPRLLGNTILGSINSEYNNFNGVRHLYADEDEAPQEDARGAFSGFIITVADGTKYYFGGVEPVFGNSTGIEYYLPYGIGAAQMDNVQFTPSSWLLTKIVDVNNNEVDFQYSASYATCDLGFGYIGTPNQTCQVTTGGFLGRTSSQFTSSGSIDINTHGGNLNLPLYLDKISCPNETIIFNRGVANSCLRFSDAVFKYFKTGGTNYPFDLSILGNGMVINSQIINGPDNLQWEQLNSIVVTNTNSQIYRQYQFTYSSNSNQRLMLNSFSELDNASSPNSIKKYSFTYNTNFPLNVLYDANFTDHWGFYNGADIGMANPQNADATANSIFSFKQTNQTLVTNNLLNTIVYPTGGYSTFTWQAHDYSQVVSNDRTTLNSVSGPVFAGGSRIREVKSYLPDGTIALDKKYLYVRGYTNADPNGTISSGVLNGTPTYNMNLVNRVGAFYNTAISVNVVSMNSLGNYSYNGQNAYMGYDQVVELNEDGSYTKSYFTNYGPDFNGISHYDIAPLNSLGWAPGDNYFLMSTLETERGKPIATFKYTSNDVLVQKKIYTYRSDPARFNNYIKMVTLNGIINGCTSVDGLILATANQKFTYNYYVTNESTTNYDQKGYNPITTSTSYGYNTNNLVNLKSEINSRGEILTTTYKYPTDYSDATSLAMTAAHILSPVIETSISKNGGFLSLTHTNYFSPYTNRYLPQNIQMQIGTNPIETRQQFYNYDTTGNLLDFSKTNDKHEVYLWGYNRQYPVAKIIGSTYSAAIAIVTQAQIDAATIISGNDVNVRSLLQALRSGLPNSLVTTYTYLPVTGITSETDPRGQTTYYQYDAFQRLKLIKDYNGNILKTFNYQYQIPL